MARRWKKYYIIGAILLTLACNVPPYAAGALGYWDLNATCWYNSPDPSEQLRWFVGTQAFWMFLMSTGEVISFLTVVGFMIFRHRVPSVMSSSVTSSMSETEVSKPPIVLYRKMILRIGLYPLFSCFLNITGAILDLHTVLDPDYTEVNWRLGIVDLLIYDLRPLMYATLAATDPSFQRALHALRHPETEEQSNATRVHVALRHMTTKTFSSGSRSFEGSASQNCDTPGPKPEGEESSSTDVESEASEFTRHI
ncbi:hypothetical protein MVEN_02226000 [Mycena venus]|uniref:G-protein coupled receptors family 2 profile 2 domain-containing protein n=1 Tax=Mycena venus TaxID=2733690 RepID=A0A8H6X7Y6_9AGAR|nr:hypothetical protein MVEN_02226000 [Mycena venus]